MPNTKLTTTEQGISPKQWEIIGGTTPPDKIKTRPGRGGQLFRYVEASYVIELLNTIFNGLWDFEITDQQVGKTQVWVKGKLTVRLSPELSITKTQFGGSDIKTNKDGGTIDIADDLKAAGQDALKKCSSLLGIAADIYTKEPPAQSQQQYSNPQQVVYGKITEPQIKLIHVLLSKSPGTSRDELKKEYGVEHMGDLTKQQASEIIDKLNKIPEGDSF